jgi:predicted PurR-regulated permease PerM
VASEQGDAAVPSSSPGRTASPRFLVTVDPRSFIGLAVGIIALLVLDAFAGSVRSAITLLGVGILLAFAVEPLVRRVHARIGGDRSAAVGIVAGALIAAIAVLAIVVGPPAIRQAQQFGDELPDVLTEIEGLPIIGDRLAEADFADNVEEWIDTLPSRLDPDRVSDAARSALNGLLNALGVVLIAIAVSLDGPVLIRRLRTLVPEQHRETADRVGRVFAHVVGTYFAGSILVACIGGTWVLTVCLLVGVPLAPIAAVWYAVVSLIPQIGGFLGTSFATLLALTQGVIPGLIVLVLVVAYMNTENYVITPAIVGQAVDLSPPVTMLAAIVGGAAGGVPGALAATPLIGTVKAVYLQTRYGLPPEAGPTTLRERLDASHHLTRLRALVRRRHR